MTENQKNYFFWNRQTFEEAVRKFVCHQCPYVGSKPEECSNPDSNGCAIFRYLPDFVRIAQRLDQPNLENFRKAVEKQISFHCEQMNSPDCALLDSPYCGLDWLLPFVLEAILKADKNLENK